MTAKVAVADIGRETEFGKCVFHSCSRKTGGLSPGSPPGFSRVLTNEPSDWGISSSGIFEKVQLRAVIEGQGGTEER